MLYIYTQIYVIRKDLLLGQSLTYKFCVGKGNECGLNSWLNTALKYYLKNTIIEVISNFYFFINQVVHELRFDSDQVITRKELKEVYEKVRL